MQPSEDGETLLNTKKRLSKLVRNRLKAYDEKMTIEPKKDKGKDATGYFTESALNSKKDKLRNLRDFLNSSTLMKPK